MSGDHHEIDAKTNLSRVPSLVSNGVGVWALRRLDTANRGDGVCIYLDNAAAEAIARIILADAATLRRIAALPAPAPVAPPSCGLTLEEVNAVATEVFDNMGYDITRHDIIAANKAAFAARAHSHTAVPNEVLERAVEIVQFKDENRYTYAEGKHEITHDLAALLPAKGE